MVFTAQIPDVFSSFSNEPLPSHPVISQRPLLLGYSALRGCPLGQGLFQMASAWVTCGIFMWHKAKSHLLVKRNGGSISTSTAVLSPPQPAQRGTPRLLLGDIFKYESVTSPSSLHLENIKLSSSLTEGEVREMRTSFPWEMVMGFLACRHLSSKKYWHSFWTLKWKFGLGWLKRFLTTFFECPAVVANLTLEWGSPCHLLLCPLCLGTERERISL